MMRYKTFFIILIFTIVSVFALNKYEYGTGDQKIIIPFIKNSIDNELYKNDYLIKEKSDYYTYFWESIAVFCKLTSISISKTFFAVYFVIIFLTFYSFLLLSRLLFNNIHISIVFLFLLSFSINTFSYAETLNNILLTRTAALPLIIFAIYYFLKNNLIISYSLLGLSFLIHPLTAIYGLIIILVSTAIYYKKFRTRDIFISILIFSVVISPIIYWKLGNHENIGIVPNSNWLFLLKLRSPEVIFPLSLNPYLYIKSILIIYLFFYSFYIIKNNPYKKIIRNFGLIILVICFISYIFTEIYPVTAFIFFQPIRIFQFFIYLTILLYSKALLDTIQSDSKIFKKIFVSLLSVVIFININYGIYLFTMFCLLLLFLLICIKYFNKFPISQIIISSLILCAAIIVLKRGDTVSIEYQPEKEWLEVQKWAKLNTDNESLFIVPPYRTGFRTESERSIYGDWKDGTMLNFSHSFGNNWYERMENLNIIDSSNSMYVFEKYKNISQQQIKKIYTNEMNNFKNFYFVSDNNQDSLKFNLMYKNAAYSVYKIN